MIRDSDASKRHLVYQPMWDMDNMVSCCSAAVVLRLEASYCTAQQRRNELTFLKTDNFSSDMPFSLRSVQNDLSSMAYAIPYNMVMAAVVQDMLSGPHDTLWICTDNIRCELGDDAHRGPFATRALATWLPHMGLADVYTGSTNNSNTVQTWSWRLDPTACQAYIAEQQELYTKRREQVDILLPRENFHTHMRAGDVSW